MTGRRVIALALVLGGALLGAAGVALIGVLALLVDWLATLWTRHGLDNLTYERTLERDRAVWGDLVEVRLDVRNAKLLPIPWLEVEDFATDTLTIVDRPLESSDRPGLGVVRTRWTVGSFQRASRTAHILADRRGIFRFGPVRRQVADLFAPSSGHAEDAQPASLVVRPRTVPVLAQDPGRPFMGTLRSRRSLVEDPSHFAGVRPFQPGDPRRRIHARASARLGTPVSRRYDPAITRTVLVVLNIQTQDGPSWLLQYDDDLAECLIVTAASLVRHALAGGAAVGLVANGWTQTRARFASVDPATGTGQLSRIEDVLGRLSSTPSLPFARMLAGLPARVPAGCLLYVVSSGDPEPDCEVLRRLDASGLEVQFVALGPRRVEWQRRARAHGLRSTAAALEPDWRTSRAVVLGAG